MAKLRIKLIATEKGIKQSHLQISAAVTPPLLNRYWNNKTSTVDLTELEKIASALGVQPGDLIVSDEQYAALADDDGQEDEHEVGKELP
jgi:DNA-binding Xre family transcriptional regulator